MGTIRIQTWGSFPERLEQFSAIQNGHANAVAEAIAWLSTVVLPAAIASDHQLQVEGANPRGGWKKQPPSTPQELHQCELIAGATLVYSAPGNIARVFEGMPDDHPGIGLVELDRIPTGTQDAMRSVALDPGQCATFGNLVRLAAPPAFPVSALLEGEP